MRIQIVRRLTRAQTEIPICTCDHQRCANEIRSTCCMPFHRGSFSTWTSLRNGGMYQQVGLDMHIVVYHGLSLCLYEAVWNEGDLQSFDACIAVWRLTTLSHAVDMSCENVSRPRSIPQIVVDSRCAFASSTFNVSKQIDVSILTLHNCFEKRLISESV